MNEVIDPQRRALLQGLSAAVVLVAGGPANTQVLKGKSTVTAFESATTLKPLAFDPQS